MTESEISQDSVIDSIDMGVWSKLQKIVKDSGKLGGGVLHSMWSQRDM